MKKLGIRERIDDAKILWDNGRKEGAFTSILIAAAATSRKRYPRCKRADPNNWRPSPGEKCRSDGLAFKTFILDEMDPITGGVGIKYNVAFPFQGRDKVPLEDILYTHLRCALVHEAQPDGITYTERIVENGKSYDVLNLTDPLGFPEAWFWNLARTIAQARENEGLFDDYSINAKRPK